MSNPLESKPVRGWLADIGNHEFFPQLIEAVAIHNRMSGWEQQSEWMEMKANGYRTGFEESIEAIKKIVDPDYEIIPSSEPDVPLDQSSFSQSVDLADYVADRFK